MPAISFGHCLFNAYMLTFKSHEGNIVSGNIFTSFMSFGERTTTGPSLVTSY